MNPASYLAALRSSPDNPWTLDQLCKAVLEGLSRWQRAQELVKLPLGFPPHVFGVEENLEIPPDLAALVPPADESRCRSVTWAYLYWSAHPATRDLPNPYESLLEVLHHGGTFSTEDIILDLESASGDRCGIPIRKRNTTSPRNIQRQQD